MVFSAISHVCNLISEIYMHLHENYAKKNPMLDLDPYFFFMPKTTYPVPI